MRTKYKLVVENEFRRVFEKVLMTMEPREVWYMSMRLGFCVPEKSRKAIAEFTGIPSYRLWDIERRFFRRIKHPDRWLATDLWFSATPALQRLINRRGLNCTILKHALKIRRER